MRYQISVKWKTPSDINSADNSGISFGVQNLPLGITGCRKDLVHVGKHGRPNQQFGTAEGRRHAEVLLKTPRRLSANASCDGRQQQPTLRFLIF